jgi:hypothetical protein
MTEYYRALAESDRRTSVLGAKVLSNEPGMLGSHVYTVIERQPKFLGDGGQWLWTSPPPS